MKIVEERLRKLINKQLSPTLQFTEKNRTNIYKALKEQSIPDDELSFVILQLLETKQTGYELMLSLENRGIRKFCQQEGALYILLHQLERKKWIESEWNERQQKFYTLADKGRKMLSSLEEKTGRTWIKGDLQYE